MSWPPTQQDVLELPDGRLIADTPTNELATMLVEYRVPGAAHTNGRQTNAEAYAEHLAKLAGGDALAKWIAEGRVHAGPRSITFKSIDGRVLVEHGWPRQVLIDEEILNNPPPYMVVNDYMITFGVANGFASYRKRELVGTAWLCIVGESEYVP